MLETRHRWKRSPWRASHAPHVAGVVLIVALVGLTVPAPAAVAPLPTTTTTVLSHSLLRSTLARYRPATLVRARRAVRPTHAVDVELAAFTPAPSAADAYVVSLIHQDFPKAAWHDAETVAWCESKFRARDIGFDSNGTHDRGLFQLNDGGTEQYLMAMLGHNPADVNLAFNPVINVRAAALLYHRDGWHPWSCQSAL